MKRAPFSILMLVVFLAACQQDLIIDADIPEPDAELVVSGLFRPDSLWEVYINTTTPLLGTTKPTAVTDATVEILEGDQVIDVLPYEGSVFSQSLPHVFFDPDENRASMGRYRSRGKQPRVGTEYRIRVTAPGFDAVTGTGHIPRQVALLEGAYRENVAADVVGALDEVRLTFEDPTGETNYYNLRVHHQGVDTTSGFVGAVSYGFSVISDLQDDFFGANPDDFLGDRDLFEVKEDGVTFNDAFFDGQRKEIVLQVRGRAARGCSSGGAFVCRTIVELSTVTEAFYRYHRTLQLQSESTENPFAEPVSIFSNMDNGLGVFAGYNTAVWIHQSP